MTWQLVYNRTAAAQVVDGARLVPPREFTYAQDTDPVVAGGVTAKRLVVVPITFDPATAVGIDPEAQAAAAEVLFRNGGAYVPPPNTFVPPEFTPGDYSDLMADVEKSLAGRFLKQRFGQRMLEVLENELRDSHSIYPTDSVGAENRTNVPPDPHEWVYKLGQRIAAAYPKYTVLFHPLNYSDFTYRTPDTIQTGQDAGTIPLTFDGTTTATGVNLSTRWKDRPITAAHLPAGTTIKSIAGNGLSLVLSQAPTGSATEPATVGPFTAHLWGAGTPGKYVQEQLAHMPAIFGVADNVDLIMPFQGHNFGFDEAAKRATLTIYIEAIRAIHPLAELVLGTQNIKIGALDEVLYPAVMRSMAQENGYGYINMRTPFQLADPTGAILLIDTAHPNDAGYELWADTIWARMYPFDPEFQPRTQSAPSLLEPARNLLKNGSFTWPLGPEWTAGGGAIGSQDFVNPDAGQAYGFQVAAVSGAAGWYEQTLGAAELAEVLGMPIAVTARVRVPAGGETLAGLIQIRDVDPTGTASVISNATDEGMGAYRWTYLPYRVRQTCTALTIRIYADFGSIDPPGVATWGRIGLAKGRRPRDISLAPPATSVKRLLSGTFPIDAVGVKSGVANVVPGLRVAHGLAYTPAPSDIQLTIASMTSPSGAIGYFLVDSTDATYIYLTARVTTAAGAGGTAKIAISIALV